MRRPWLTSVVAAALCAASLTACGTAHPARPDNLITMTVAAPTVTDFDDYVAKAKGFYAKHGITVQRVQTGTATQSVQLLATGEVDVGRGLANTVLARLRTEGALDFVDVADTTVRPPFVMSAKGISGFADLRGTSVGIPSVTDQATVVTHQFLQRMGVDPAGVEMIPTGGTGNRLAAMNAGGTSSTLLLPPVNFTAEQQGAKRLGYLPELLGPGYQFSFTGVVVRASWARDHRDQLVRYLAARDDALRWLNDPANAEEAARILAAETKSPPQRAKQTYELLFRSKVPAFADRIGVSVPAGEGVIDGLRLVGLLPGNPVDVRDFVDDSYAAEARRTPR
ncbi:ABC transporter substrate-binding protein [Amycolatopsis sp. NPDC058986]|uniref:ABC transporter substrate-binding protein n=1 Tax=unclassified Amycolatopsis TaxID=2618356 RepID=UPI0036732323